MQKPWYIGNTSVRNPYRLKGGLSAIAHSPLQGNMRQHEGDKALSLLLADAGLVSLREDMHDDSYSIGRKWRSALAGMGFLFPKVGSRMSQDLVGPFDYITPNGQRLIEAQSVAGEQECYLRALAGQVKTIPLLEGGKYSFNPLRHILGVMREVENRTGEPSVNAIELALWLFSTIPSDSYAEIVDGILDLRERRKAAQSKRRFDNEEYARCAHLINSNKPHTFKDYLDANMRYLKATGIVQSKGSGLTIIPEKKTIAYAIVDLPHPDWETEEALAAQCRGVDLPTDDAETAVKLLFDETESLVSYYSIEYDFSGLDLEDAKEVQQARYEVEELLGKAKEEHYALDQRNQWREIDAYLGMLSTRRESLEIDEDTSLHIPRSETAAYMEWAVWRAFLAMDSITTKPFEVRRFNVDQDFLPLSTAPGRGSDLVVELDDCILAVEVTLTESSRQEAAEGEPVRRHVADLSFERSDKPVIGLFIANNIDSNTAETFRIGSWYDQNDNRSSLTIVPLTTSSFRALFSAIFNSNTCSPRPLIDVLYRCDEIKDEHEAPEWKREICEIVESAAAGLLAS